MQMMGEVCERSFRSGHIWIPFSKLSFHSRWKDMMRQSIWLMCPVSQNSTQTTCLEKRHDHLPKYTVSTNQANQFQNTHGQCLGLNTSIHPSSKPLQPIPCFDFRKLVHSECSISHLLHTMKPKSLSLSCRLISTSTYKMHLGSILNQWPHRCLL